MAYVYSHTRLDTNEVFYIGIGSDVNYKRANSKNGRNSYWKRIANKTDYKVEILINDISWDDACLEETRLIKQYGRKNLNEGTLCNLTDGGEGQVGFIVSDETKQKIAAANIGKKVSEEARLRMSASQMGKKLSDEHKQKIGDAHRGKIISEETRTKKRNSMTGIKWSKPMSEETRIKIGEYRKGRMHNEDAKNKIGDANRGKPNQYKGVPRSEETKRRISEGHKNKRIIQQPVVHTFF